MNNTNGERERPGVRRAKEFGGKRRKRKRSGHRQRTVGQPYLGRQRQRVYVEPIGSNVNVQRKIDQKFGLETVHKIRALSVSLV